MTAKPTNIEPVQSDSSLRKQAADDKSNALQTVLDSWKDQAKEERGLRRTYAMWLIIALFAQTVAVNIAFFLIGWKCLDVDEWTARTFIMAVFSELAAMVFFIVKYLFSRDEKIVAEIMQAVRDSSHIDKPL